MYHQLVEEVHEFLEKRKSLQDSINSVYLNFSKRRGNPSITVNGLKTAFYRTYGKADQDRRNKLTLEEEDSVVLTLQGFSLADLPLDQSYLKNVINATFDVDCSNPYMTRFLKKHEQELVVTKCKILANKRTSEYILPFIDYFIEKFSVLVEKKLVTAKNLLNYDESRIGPQQGDKTTGLKIVARADKKHNIAGSRLHIVSSIVPFVSPLGKVFAVVYISKARFSDDGEALVEYNLVPFKWKRNEGFHEIFQYSETGFVTEALFRVMMQKVNELWKLDNPGLDLYLLGDNCRVHLNLGLLFDMAMKGSHLIFLPPNTTVITQPLDQKMFAAVKGLVYQLLEQKIFDMMLLGKKDEYWTIPEAQIATHKALTEEVVRSGFEDTGIWPWNPQKLKSNAERVFPKTYLDPRQEICVNIVKTVISQAKERNEDRDNQVTTGNALVKKNYPYDFMDHIQKSQDLKEQKKKAMENAAMKKRKRQEEKESIKKARLEEKSKKRAINTCKNCEMLWRGSSSWVGCSHCDEYWVCANCIKSNEDIVETHEAICKKKK